jgi:hypothetical protein
MVGRFLPGRLMKEARVFSTQYRKHRNREADGESAIATNALDWQFTVSGLNQVWCGDVTCVWAGNRWIYLAAVMDLYARRIVAGHSPLGRTSNLQRGLCAWPSSPVVVRSSWCFTLTKVAITPASSSAKCCGAIESNRG